MKCTLIIYVKNGGGVAPLLFESLGQQTEQDFEVIVAEDGADKNLSSYIRSISENMPFEINHISHSDTNYKRESILNRAIMEAKSEYLIFLESDVVLHHKYISEHLRLSSIRKVVAARTIEIEEELFKSITSQHISSKKIDRYIKSRLLFSMIKGRTKPSIEMFRITNGFMRHFFLDDYWQGLSSDNFSLYRDDIIAVNGFDERFDDICEESDFDLELRLMRLGVVVKEERCIATMYKLKQSGKNRTSSVSSHIFKENSEGEVVSTPYGIVKGEESIKQ